MLRRYALEAFEPGKRYSDDTAALRRGLIEYKLMAREVTQGGSTYWRIDRE